MSPSPTPSDASTAASNAALQQRIQWLEAVTLKAKAEARNAQADARNYKSLTRIMALRTLASFNGVTCLQDIKDYVQVKSNVSMDVMLDHLKKAVRERFAAESKDISETCYTSLQFALSQTHPHANPLTKESLSDAVQDMGTLKSLLNDHLHSSFMNANLNPPAQPWIATVTPPKEKKAGETVVLFFTRLIMHFRESLSPQNVFSETLRSAVCRINGDLKAQGNPRAKRIDGIVGKFEDVNKLTSITPDLMVSSSVLMVEVKRSLKASLSRSQSNVSRDAGCAVAQCIARLFQALSDFQSVYVTESGESKEFCMEKFKQLLKKLLPLPFISADANSFSVLLFEYNECDSASSELQLFPISVLHLPAICNLPKEAEPNRNLNTWNLTQNSLLLFMSLVLALARKEVVPPDFNGSLEGLSITAHGTFPALRSTNFKFTDASAENGGSVSLKTVQIISGSDNCSRSPVMMDQVTVRGANVLQEFPHWLSSNQYVATKVLSVDTASNEAECWKLAYKSSPSGVPPVFIGRDARGILGISPFYSGWMPLSSIPTVEPPRARIIIAQLHRIVEEIHSAGVVHGDLHPDNVLIQSSWMTAGGMDPGLRVIDFGMSRRFLAYPESTSPLTHATTTLSVEGSKLHEASSSVRSWKPLPKDDLESVVLIGEVLIANSRLHGTRSAADKRLILANRAETIWNIDLDYTEKGRKRARPLSLTTPKTKIGD